MEVMGNVMNRILVILMFSFASCFNSPRVEQIDNIDDTIQNNNIHEDKKIIVQSDTQITTRFIQLAHLLDNKGYTYDTARFTKTYGRAYHGKQFELDGYCFYKIPFNKTIIFGHIMRCDTNTSEHIKEWCNDWKLNMESFNSTQSITQYFYIDKNYKDPNFHGEKYFADGIVEEWKFPDSKSARLAAKELGEKEEMVFVLCTGFICYIENYMYGFQSRAINFMYSIKPVFKDFTNKTNAIQTNLKLIGD